MRRIPETSVGSCDVPGNSPILAGVDGPRQLQDILCLFLLAAAGIGVRERTRVNAAAQSGAFLQLRNALGAHPLLEVGSPHGIVYLELIGADLQDPAAVFNCAVVIARVKKRRP